MPRFVILAHDHPAPHWDFMLEAGLALLTWRLASFPDPGQDVLAERISDHRLAYLDYEGPVSGGRGTVTLCDGGDFEWGEDGEDRKIVRLCGHRLRGTFRLERTGDGHWLGHFAE